MRLVRLIVLALCFVGFTICYAEDTQPVDLNKLAQFLPMPLEGWAISSHPPAYPDTGSRVFKTYDRLVDKYSLPESVNIIINYDRGSPRDSILTEGLSDKAKVIKTDIKGFPAVEIDDGFAYSLKVNIKNKIIVDIGAAYFSDPNNIAKIKGYLYKWSGKINYQGLADLVK